MKAQTITTINRRRARRRLIALVLAVGALVIPVSANAVPIDSGPYSPSDPITGGSSDSGYVSPNAILGPATGEPTFVSESPETTGDGFDSASAALGAGAAIALVALGGAVLFTVRRRPGVSPSASTT